MQNQRQQQQRAQKQERGAGSRLAAAAVEVGVERAEYAALDSTFPLRPPILPEISAPGVSLHTGEYYPGSQGRC